MKSAKSLKQIAVRNPQRVGRPENLQAVKHHLLKSEGTEQAFAADAAAKLAYSDPHAAQQIRDTLEQIAEGFHQRPVNERVNRALSHIDSQIDTSRSNSRSNSSDRTGGDRHADDEHTQIYRQQPPISNADYCKICGTELPDSGPTNYCPGCGAKIS